MRFSDELLHGPPEVFRKVLALERVYGMASSYVRGRKRGTTLSAVSGQVQSARRNGASEEEIRAKVRQGITDSPNADPERVKELEQHFLKKSLPKEGSQD